MRHPFIFHEIVTPSPSELCRFYGEVFGWCFQQMDDQGALFAILPDRPGDAPAGLLTQTSAEPGFAQATLFYVQVGDIDSFLPGVVALGGEIVMPAASSMLGEWQYRLAVISDPQQNQIGVMEPVTRDGQMVPVPVTPFRFNEIVTPEPITLADEFYASLFDWQIRQTGTAEAPFLTISTGQSQGPEGGIAKIADRPGFNQFASFYIEVNHLESALGRIVQSGGQVVMPQVTVTLGKDSVTIAMFTDPQQNQLGLISRMGGSA
ncbi:VOC family protein [Photobacterium sp. 53610]|uniref:VOC family protein n=1 Tax=Photobacterium sp. 53610 TaxID=3102789 RepID=UPI002ED9BC43